MSFAFLAGFAVFHGAVACEHQRRSAVDAHPARQFSAKRRNLRNGQFMRHDRRRNAEFRRLLECEGIKQIQKRPADDFFARFASNRHRVERIAKHIPRRAVLQLLQDFIFRPEQPARQIHPRAVRFQNRIFRTERQKQAVKFCIFRNLRRFAHPDPCLRCVCNMRFCCKVIFLYSFRLCRFYFFFKICQRLAAHTVDFRQRQTRIFGNIASDCIGKKHRSAAFLQLRGNLFRSQHHALCRFASRLPDYAVLHTVANRCQGRKLVRLGGKAEIHTVQRRLFFIAFCIGLEQRIGCGGHIFLLPNPEHLAPALIFKIAVCKTRPREQRFQILPPRRCIRAV